MEDSDVISNPTVNCDNHITVSKKYREFIEFFIT